MISRSLDRISERRPVAVWLVIGVFVLTRFLGVWGAIHFDTVSDVEIAYRRWAVRLLEQDRPPYSDVDIEYPPASLPFVLAPQLPHPSKADYRVNYALLMLLMDIACFAGILLLSRRWKSMLGPWLWVFGLFLLGPFVYLRLDLVPAAATIWAMQRAASDDWTGTGAFLGFGAVAKLYPLLLLPLALLMAPKEKRARLLIGFGVISFLVMAPFALILKDVFREVIEYHTARGIQIESLWGSLLFIARSGVRNRWIYHDFGAQHFRYGAVPLLKTISSIATVAVAGAGVWLAARSPKNAVELAGTSFATLMLAIAVSGVLSPQFFIWVLAMGAVVVCTPRSRLRNQAMLLIPIIALTRFIYPTLHPDLVSALAFPVGVLWVRNMLLLITAIYAATRQFEAEPEPTPSDPSIQVPASAGTR